MPVGHEESDVNTDVEEQGKSPEELQKYIESLERENQKLKQTVKQEQKRKKEEKKQKKKKGADTNIDAAAKQEDLETMSVDVTAWKDFYLDEKIIESLGRLGFAAPTQIQAECLPAAIRDKRDIIGAAQTVRTHF